MKIPANYPATFTLAYGVITNDETLFIHRIFTVIVDSFMVRRCSPPPPFCIPYNLYIRKY